MRRVPVFLLLGAALLALSACDAGEAAEEHEHPSVVVTQWNDSTELFLEYPVPLAGQAMGNWAIHLSNMKNFRPLTEGVLTVRFMQGGREAQTFTIEAPARDGIYLLDEPEAALSPQRQLAFLRTLHDHSVSGAAQFIIATHSPILLAFPGATILSLDGDSPVEVEYRETSHYRITREFLEAPERFFKHLLQDD